MYELLSSFELSQTLLSDRYLGKCVTVPSNGNTLVTNVLLYVQRILTGKREKLWKSLELIGNHSCCVTIDDCDVEDNSAGVSIMTFEILISLTLHSVIYFLGQ